MNSKKVIIITVVTLTAILGVGGVFYLNKQAVQTGGQKNVWSLPLSGQPTLSQLSNRIIKTGATYKSVTTKPSGWFGTSQDASILLSGIDFNNAGGALLFNHPGGIASDGKRLLLADRNNNRVLIWNSLPLGNAKPDLVLGQTDFNTNNPGNGLNQLNWPVGVATDGTRVVVADTYNDRVLIWNFFPTRNNQPADLVLANSGNNNPNNNNLKRTIIWPWAVWTNGHKLVITSTQTSSALIWNSFPTSNGQPADIALKAQGKFGTPRSIASNGNQLMIGDHNAESASGSPNPGNFFWTTFPTEDDQPYDFLLSSGSGDTRHGEIFWGGTFTPKGKFLTIGDSLYIWNAFPQSENDQPAVTIGNNGPVGDDAYRFKAGDGSGVVLADQTLYISTTNDNKIVAYKTVPLSTSQKPDFAIGAPDIETNTLETNFIMSNPVPETDGKSLFVASDFDNKLYVYNNLPDQANAHPDYVYPYGGWDSAIYQNVYAEANSNKVYIWKTLPTTGNEPDIVLKDQIGNIRLQEAKGVAIDDKYFYLSDAGANKIYVFEGIPSQDSVPKFTLKSDRPLRLSSDGQYLVVANSESNDIGHIRIYQIDKLQNDSQPQILKFSSLRTNLPQSATVSHGSLFIADTGFNRVLAWKNIADALSGKQPDVILGQNNLKDTAPAIGKNTGFWPSNVAFDGSFLWVGEFKFSERLLRFDTR